MFPELFSIGPVTIHSYGLMVAVGVITAVWLADARAMKTGVAEDGFMFMLGLFSLIGGFAGSKILFWLTILPDVIANPSIMLDFANGFVVYGGLIGGILTAVVYCKIKKTDFFACFDVAAPVIALAQFFGRIGCFLTGCCYGQQTEGSFGVVFHDSLYAPVEVPLFPIQLVSAGLNLINFLFLSWLWQRKPKKGAVGAVYIITYSVGRFVLEFFRGDLERGSVGALSTSQFISIFTVIIGVGMLIRLLYYKGEEKR
ncbi:MAG: prolipoprotein diacylglyceryl transferase [Lachnospiraceae bacterium]|nr:prolipoprotein diacylglyceryl transferase [Lachnospiraceae bacterium]